MKNAYKQVLDGSKVPAIKSCRQRSRAIATAGSNIAARDSMSPDAAVNAFKPA